MRSGSGKSHPRKRSGSARSAVLPGLTKAHKTTRISLHGTVPASCPEGWKPRRAALRRAVQSGSDNWRPYVSRIFKKMQDNCEKTFINQLVYILDLHLLDNHNATRILHPADGEDQAARLCPARSGASCRVPDNKHGAGRCSHGCTQGARAGDVGMYRYPGYPCSGTF